MKIEDIEIQSLTVALQQRYGYDFRDYSPASLKRRLKNLTMKHQLASISQLQHELLYRPDLFISALADLTVPTTEMFRDPEVYLQLRQEIIPVLATYPTLKIWHAGCSTGEEAYSLAILLTEAGLYDRSIIYATDINPAALKRARDGIYSSETIRTATANYHAAGGTRAFSDYYVALYDAARFDSKLSTNIVFSEHNLATDEVFSEMNLILCRNVLIYFNRELQCRVLDLFARSLAYKGFLCLGTKESLNFLTNGNEFKPISAREKIFQKVSARNSSGKENAS